MLIFMKNVTGNTMTVGLMLVVQSNKKGLSQVTGPARNDHHQLQRRKKES